MARRRVEDSAKTPPLDGRLPGATEAAMVTVVSGIESRARSSHEAAESAPENNVAWAEKTTAARIARRLAGCEKDMPISLMLNRVGVEVQAVCLAGAWETVCARVTGHSYDSSAAPGTPASVCVADDSPGAVTFR